MTPSEILAFADRAVLCLIPRMEIDVSFNNETVLAYHEHSQQQSVNLQIKLHQIRLERLIPQIERLLETQELLVSKTLNAVREYGREDDKIRLGQTLADEEIMVLLRREIVLSWQAREALYQKFLEI